MVELRVRAHEVEEGGEVALEADPLHDCAHLVVDPRDFAQADVMDLDAVRSVVVKFFSR